MHKSGGFFMQYAADMVWLAVAIVGGVARYCDAYLRTGGAPRLGNLCAQIVVSGFAGYMLAQIMMHFSPGWAGIAAGVGGYLGTRSLEIVEQVMRVKLGLPAKSIGDGEPK